MRAHRHVRRDRFHQRSVIATGSNAQTSRRRLQAPDSLTVRVRRAVARRRRARCRSLVVPEPDADADAEPDSSTL